MGLLLGVDYEVFPSGEHRDELERRDAAIQTWAGKQDSNGRWIIVPFNASDFIARGAGNSWVVPNTYYNRISYTIIGDTMLLNIYISGSTLTASGSAINIVSVRIPDGYRVKGATVNGTVTEGLVFGHTATVFAATAYENCIVEAAPNAPTELQFSRYSGNWADGGFGLRCQIAIEVVRL